ncbi:MAG: hypothetical protein AAF439_05995 [Pseudomonadota bacterium]
MIRTILKTVSLAAALAALSPAAYAVDRITVEVVNKRPFILSLELKDMNCGGNVIFREQLDAGETRQIEICANKDGLGALGATFGSGCSQVKRTDIRDIAEGDDLSF